MQRVIFATGVGDAFDSDGLIAGLLGAGLARTDRHGLGLDVTDELEVIAGDGTVLPCVWALGPIVRGVFWECTAVPDIRLQATRIAQAVAANFAAAREANDWSVESREILSA